MTIGTVKWFNAPKVGGFNLPQGGAAHKACARDLRQV